MPSTGERSSLPKPIVPLERWRRYRRDGDRAARDELIVAYSPLVKYIAGRIAARMPAHVELAELISYGFGGLIAAVERFDPDHGAKFESFAGLRIRGAIFDELRSMDWVPRAIREEGREVERATAALLLRLQRLPNDAELAEELCVDAAQLDRVLQRMTTSRMVALDQPWNVTGGDGTPSSASPGSLLDTLADPAAVDPASVSADADLRDRLGTAIAQLPGREQTILALYYHQQLTLAEIGRILGVTESRVSQIHAKSVVHLRALLADPIADAEA
ncbi:MAG TPA: FliA/WhiG family RNA polymerase sigma factor [Baekduia sp.]|nr:FliA/WhiG family RNA polymerase sigma factor [Baekduia sp.]